MPWLETINQIVFEFLDQFIGKPDSYYPQWSWDLIIRCESTHFLFSLFLGWVVFSLTWTILSSAKPEWQDHYIFRSSLLFGLSASVTMHIVIDGFTTLA